MIAKKLKEALSKTPPRLRERKVTGSPVKILTLPGLRGYVEQEESILKRNGYRIFTAASGDEVLKIHRVERADLIFVDLDMPGVAGDELCTAIKRDEDLGHAYTILACRDNRSHIKRCTDSKADFFLTKPINSVLLLRKLREILDIQPRRSHRVPLKITVVGSAGETFFCRARDLSATGILIESDRILRRGHSVGCLFCLDDSREIIVQGKVARVHVKSHGLYQYGIKFSPFSTDAQVAVNEIQKPSRRKATG